jgi:hypothetical protein
MMQSSRCYQLDCMRYGLSLLREGGNGPAAVTNDDVPLKVLVKAPANVNE